MSLANHRSEKSLKSLIEMGTNGHFPLFFDEWIGELGSLNLSLSEREGYKAKRLLERIKEHRTIERQKVVLMGLTERERQLVMRAFIKMVETKILDKRPELH